MAYPTNEGLSNHEAIPNNRRQISRHGETANRTTRSHAIPKGPILNSRHSFSLLLRSFPARL